jgi:hypothetical protein
MATKKQMKMKPIDVDHNAVVTIELFAKSLLDSFDEWGPKKELSDDAEKLEIMKAIQGAKKEINDSPAFKSNLKELLKRTCHVDQLYWAILNANRLTKHPLFSPEIWQEIETRKNELSSEEDSEKPLIVSVQFDLEKVFIPDNAKDEIVLKTRFVTSTKLGILLDQMCKDGIIKKERIALLRRHLEDKETFNDLPENELIYFTDVLGIKYDGQMHQTEVIERFPNYNPETEELCLNSIISITLIGDLNLRNYPFDVSSFTFYLVSDSGFSSDGLILKPDNTGNGAYTINDGAHPIGYKICAKSESLKEMIRYEGTEILPTSLLAFSFAFKRNPENLIWRTLVPALVIIAIGFFSVVGSLLSGKYMESVMTALVPGILIACVALQLTSAQLIPPNSGRTTLDIFFLWIYTHIFFLFLSLLLYPEYSWFLMVGSVISLICSMGLIIWRYWEQKKLVDL